MFEKSTKISVVTGSRSIAVGDRAITKFDPVLGYYVLPADDEDEGYYDI